VAGDNNIPVRIVTAMDLGNQMIERCCLGCEHAQAVHALTPLPLHEGLEIPTILVEIDAFDVNIAFGGWYNQARNFRREADRDGMSHAVPVVYRKASF
jgi:hypothetical protein